MERKKTRQIQLGTVTVGGNAPISIQSMSTVNPVDTDKAIADVLRLETAGCELIRMAVPDMAAAKALQKIKQHIHIPLIADIHFDYRLALVAIDSGVDGLRINPGNIGSLENVTRVVEKAKPKKIPIRIGINAGSLPEAILSSYGGHPTADGMVETALAHIRLLEQLDYREIKLSLKATEVPLMIAAYQQLSDKVDYPLHLGVTEAGTLRRGSIKSAIGIGALLNMGIGDTIRVSLTGDPIEEVKVAQEILSSLELRSFGATMISCPTCGRCNIALIDLANEVEAAIANIKEPLRIAVMGCIVNGPGEAREADFGLAGGNGSGIIFSHGKILKTVPEKNLVSALLKEIHDYLEKRSSSC